MNISHMTPEQRAQGATIADNNAWSKVIRPLIEEEEHTVLERLVRAPTEADAAYIRGLRFAIHLPEQLSKNGENKA